MSIAITFPKYSFVQAQGAYDPSDCYHDPSFCLPLSNPQNLQFNAVITGTDIAWIYSKIIDEHDTIFLYAAVVPVGKSCTPARYDYTPGTGFLPLFEPYFRFVISEKHQITDLITGREVAFFNFGDFIANAFDELTIANNGFVPAVGDCFKLMIWYDLNRFDPDTFTESIPYRVQVGCTNCFVRTSSVDCYTSLLTYSCPTDTFDFIYQIGTSPVTQTQNKVELPIYLRDPVMNDDTKVYTKSDGSIVKLYERKEEQYILETDLMPYTCLKALDVALSHDYVSIQNTNAAAYDSINTALAFQKKENFEIEYQKGPLSALGKGTCKLLNANPVHLYNNNCS